MSVNFQSGGFGGYVDGNLAVQRSDISTQYNADFSAVEYITIGGRRYTGNTAGSNLFTGVIDYVNVYDNRLTEAQIAELSGTQTASANAVISPIANTTASAWLFAGGATTEGIMGDYISAKNYVQCFDEVIRRSYNFTAQVTCAQRFVINEGKRGITSQQILNNYNTGFYSKYDPNVMFVMPDIKYNGVVVESSVESFKQNLQMLKNNASRDGLPLIFITPASVDPDIADYVNAMKEVAGTNTPIIELYTYFCDINAFNPEMETLWFDKNLGTVNEIGHLMAVKYILSQMGITQSSMGTTTSGLTLRPYSSWIYGLDYIDDNSATKNEVYKDILTAERSESDATTVTFASASLLDNSRYFLKNATLYKVTDSGDELVTISPSVDNILTQDFTLTNVSAEACQYKIVAEVLDSAGNVLKTVTYPVEIPATVTEVTVTAEVTGTGGNIVIGTDSTQNPAATQVQTIENGTEITFTAVPNTDNHYEFVNWTDAAGNVITATDGNPVGETYTFTATATTTIYANFKEITSDLIIVLEDAISTAQALQKESGYRKLPLSIRNAFVNTIKAATEAKDDIDATRAYLLTALENLNTANLGLDRSLLQAVINECDAIDTNDYYGTQEVNDFLTALADANEAYHATDATVDSLNTARTTLEAAKGALKEKIQITVTSFDIAQGTVTGGGKYAPNTSVTLTATAEDGYVFKCWTENGVIISDAECNPVGETLAHSQ